MTDARRKTWPIVVGLLLAVKAAVLLLPDLLRVAPDVARVGPEMVRTVPWGVVDEAAPIVVQDDWGRITDAALSGAEITVDAVGLIEVEDE